MTENPSSDLPACCPYLFYDDLAEAIRFLQDAFGFEKLFAFPGQSGAIEHAQLRSGPSVFMLGSTASPGSLRPIASRQELRGLLLAFFRRQKAVFAPAAKRLVAIAIERAGETIEIPLGLLYRLHQLDFI